MEILKNTQQAAELCNPVPALLAGCCGECNLAAVDGSAQQFPARCVTVVFSSHQSRRVPVFKEWTWCLS